MKLHEKPNEFKQLVQNASEYFEIREVFIEKDYWVTYVLKNLSNSKHKDKVIFKGGTSLSKVHKSIRRFSEDVDLAYVDVNKRRCQDVFSKIDKSIMLSPLAYEKNDEEKKGPPKFRKTYYSYPRIIENSNFGHATDKLILEINSFTKPEPAVWTSVDSYIAEYLKTKEMLKEIEEFELGSFEIQVLDKEKTLAEKLCGLAKYTCDPSDLDFATLKEKIRHVYDVSKLLDDEELKAKVQLEGFIKHVRTTRSEDRENFMRESWVDKKFSESKIFNDTDNVMSKVKNYYNTNFADLLYGSETLPDIEYVGTQIKEIYKILKKTEEA